MPLTNFNDYSGDLSPEEMEIIPIVIHGFRRYDKNNPIKSKLIVTRLNEYLFLKGYKIKMSGVRLRKIVNYIRSNGLIPLIATSKGYFVSKNKMDILDQIKSLKERARSIERCAKGLEKFIKD